MRSARLHAHTFDLGPEENGESLESLSRGYWSYLCLRKMALAAEWRMDVGGHG